MKPIVAVGNNHQIYVQNGLSSHPSERISEELGSQRHPCGKRFLSHFTYITGDSTYCCHKQVVKLGMNILLHMSLLWSAEKCRPLSIALGENQIHMICVDIHLPGVSLIRRIDVKENA